MKWSDLHKNQKPALGKFIHDNGLKTFAEFRNIHTWFQDRVERGFALTDLVYESGLHVADIFDLLLAYRKRPYTQEITELDLRERLPVIHSQSRDYMEVVEWGGIARKDAWRVPA